MADGNTPLAQPAGPELCITRTFDAPRSLVFKLWTQSEYLKQWSCPKDFTTTFSEGDIRPGGAWRMCMRSPEGKDYCVRGIYHEVVSPERVVFTHAWEDAEGNPGHETLVTVTFSEQAGKTKQTFYQAVFQSVEERDSHEEGWKECFDKLAEHLPVFTSSENKR